MAKEKEEFKDSSVMAPKKGKCKITNKCNRSIELCIKFRYYRLEPFGKEGDTIIINKEDLGDLKSDMDNIQVRDI